MLKKEHSIFARTCILVLGINQKVKVRFRKGKAFKYREFEFPIVGYHLNKNGRHLIEVAINTNQGWREILAHEMVHAWVDENHPKAKWHGRTFQRTAAGMRRALRDFGYELKPLYTKGLDP